MTVQKASRVRCWFCRSHLMLCSQRIDCYKPWALPRLEHGAPAMSPPAGLNLALPMPFYIADTL